MDDTATSLLHEVRALQTVIRIVSHRVNHLIERLETHPTPDERDELIQALTRLLEEYHT